MNIVNLLTAHLVDDLFIHPSAISENGSRVQKPVNVKSAVVELHLSYIYIQYVRLQRQYTFLRHQVGSSRSVHIPQSLSFRSIADEFRQPTVMVAKHSQGPYDP